MISLEIEGLKDLEKALEGFGRDLTEYIEEELESVAKTVLEASNSRAPEDTGALIESGTVEVTDGTIEIRYDVDYAYAVHERTEVRHTNGEAKFLEKAIDENRGLVEEAIQRAFKRALL